MMYELHVDRYGPDRGYLDEHYTVRVVGLELWVDGDSKDEALDRAARALDGVLVWQGGNWAVEVRP